MALRLVIGRAGSGKTALCHREIVEAMRAEPLGRPIYWVVPRQMTFSTERWLACDSGLGASARCRVVSFERLAEEVLTEFPGPVRAMMSATARRAILAHLIRKNAKQLRHFGPSADQPGLAGEVMALLDELARDGLLGEEGSEDDPLERAALDLAAAGRPGDDVLAEKLGDLRRIRDAYRSFIGTDGFDKNRQMQHALRHVGQCRRFQGASFYIDGFLEFMDFERRMTVALYKTAETTGGNVVITFGMPTDSPIVDQFDLKPDDRSVFHRVESAYRELRILLRSEKGIKVEHLTQPARFGSPGLSAIEAHFATAPPRPRSLEAIPDLERILAQTPGDEVEAVARRIRDLTFSGPGSVAKYRFRDIVVLARDLQPYEREIQRRFDAHGIRHFLDRRVDASAHPLVRLIRTLLAVACDGITTDHVLGMCRTGLLPDGTPDEVAALARWCTCRGLGDDAWTAAGKNYPTAPEHFETLRLNLIPRLSAWKTFWAGTVSARAACAGLLDLIRSLGLTLDLTDAENEQVFAQILGDAGVLEELAEALGDEAMSAQDFSETLGAALLGLDLGLVPPGVDEVLVGTAERTRPGNARVVFVLGMSEGMFPARAEESPLLPDRDRKRLAEGGRSLRMTANRLALDEQLIGYLALSRAGEKLVVSRPLAATNGTPLAASVFWSELDTAAVTPQADITPGDHPVLAARSWHQLAAAVAYWAASGAGGGDTVSVAGYELLRAAAATEGVARMAVQQIWPSLDRPADHVALAEEVVAKLYADPLEMPHHRLATFAECPFRHYVCHVLKPQRIARPSLRPWQMGKIAHEVMDRALVEVIRTADGRWSDVPPDELRKELRATARACIERLTRELTDDGSTDPRRLSPAGRHLLGRAESLADDLIAAEFEAAKRTGFRPAAADVGFGQKRRRPPLRITLTGGRTLLISGTLDRVDTDKAGRALVWDFTSGDKSCNRLVEMYHGLKLQLLVSMLLVEQLAAEGNGELGKVAIGAVELPMRSSMGSVKTYDKYLNERSVPREDRTAERRRVRGPVSSDAVHDLDQSIRENERSRVYHVALTSSNSPHEGQSDTLTASAFRALLEQGHSRLRQLGERLTSGDITPRPCKLGTTSACVRCEQSTVCRFNPRGGYRYLELVPASVKSVRAELAAGADGGAT